MSNFKLGDRVEDIVLRERYTSGWGTVIGFRTNEEGEQEVAVEYDLPFAKELEFVMAEGDQP